MATVNEYDALTGENTSTEMSDEKFAKMIGELSSTKTMDEAIAESQALKDSALVKLAALGLTEDEAKAIIG